MINLKTILNFGVSNPLILGMGHPVKDRVGRLLRPAMLRGGSIVALILIGGGLVGTSFARPELVDTSMPDMVMVYFNVEAGVKSMSTETQDENAIVFRFSDPNAKFVGVSADKKLGFIPLSVACFEHARQHKTPIVFEAKGKLFEHETDDTKYQIWCTPGTEIERATLQKADFIAGIQASSDLSNREKTRAIENMQFSKDVSIQLHPH